MNAVDKRVTQAPTLYIEGSTNSPEQRVTAKPGGSVRLRFRSRFGMYRFEEFSKPEHREHDAWMRPCVMDCGMATPTMWDRDHTQDLSCAYFRNLVQVWVGGKI